MSFKRPYVPTWGRQRTQAEIDQDARLDAISRELVASTKGPGKIEGVRAQYRHASRAGLTKSEIYSRYTNSDLAIMEEHVDQMFDQMVRHEYATNPTFVRNMQFIEVHYRKSAAAFLNAIKNRFWAHMQKWTDDKSHRAFLTEIYRAYHAGQVQVTPEPFAAHFARQANRPASNPDLGRRPHASIFGRRGVRRQRQNHIDQEMWNALDDEQQALEADAMVPEFWEAFDARRSRTAAEVATNVVHN